MHADQQSFIAEEVQNRRYILKTALINLSRTIRHIEQPPKTVNQPIQKTKTETTTKQLTKSPKPKAVSRQSDDEQALKGRVSYKVKGPGGKLMNIAEVKAWVNRIYEGKQGAVKHNEHFTQHDH